MVEGICNICGSDVTEEQGAVPKLMAYMVLIIWADKEYAEGAWMPCDAAYHQQ